MEKSRGLVLQFVAYAVALLFAIITYHWFAEWEIVYRFLIADLVGTLIIFLISRFYNNSSFYDPYWSLQPIVMVLFLHFVFADAASDSVRNWMVLFLVSFWGLRLTYNFIRGWKGLSQQDWRYDGLEKKHGVRYWWVSLGGIHLLPTILVFAGCLCFFVVFVWVEREWGLLDVIATLITSSAIFLEAAADEQLHRFKKTPLSVSSTFQKGLWKYMRHPNYLGEIFFWWGLFLFGLAANPSYWWTCIGPLSITLLFISISIPMIDERMSNKRSDYITYAENTPALIPRIKI